MRYLFLSSALSSLVLAHGAALAQQATDPNQPTEQTYSSEQSQTQGQTTEHKSAENVQNVNMFFDTNSAELKGDARAELKELADWAACDTRNAIILEGFADPRGSVDHNQELSGRRAAAVRQELISLGVPSQRIVISVFGENGPRKDSMAQERRVTARAAATPVTPNELSG